MKFLICALLLTALLAIVPSVTGQACLANCIHPTTTTSCPAWKTYVACLQKACVGDSIAQTAIEQFIASAKAAGCDISGSGTTLVASLMTTLIAAVVSLVYLN